MWCIMLVYHRSHSIAISSSLFSYVQITGHLKLLVYCYNKRKMNALVLNRTVIYIVISILFIILPLLILLGLTVTYCYIKYKAVLEYARVTFSLIISVDLNTTKNTPKTEISYIYEANSIMLKFFNVGDCNASVCEICMNYFTFSIAYFV